MSFFFFINWGRKKAVRLTSYKKVERTQEIITIPGAIEITRPRNDILALNLASPVNIKSSLQGIIDQINRQNGLAILCHPTYLVKPYNRRKLLRLKEYLGIEIYSPNKIPWPESTRRWDFILSRIPDTKVWGFASDDMHDLKRDAGRAWIVVKTEKAAVPMILEALRRGAFYSTTGPVIDNILLGSNNIHIKLASNYQMKFIGYRRRILQISFGKESTYYIQPEDRYVRIEIKDLKYRKKAWTQPIFTSDGKISYFTYPENGDWLRGCIHIHTNFNGGTAEQREVIEWYQEHSYDFLAITDHNFINHPKILPEGNIQGKF